MPKASFVLSVFNKEAWIAQTMKSIQNQTEKDIEIIVWNDGTEDSSMDIINYLASKDSRIIVCGTKYNQGISKALNQAYQLVRSPYIIVASGDDIYSEDRAELTIKYLDKYPEVDVIYGNFKRVKPTWELIEHKIPNEWVKGELFKPFNQYIPHGFMSIRTRMALKVPYDETLRYGIDYPWLKALESNGCMFKKVEHEFGYYMWIKSNTSINHRGEIWTKDLNDARREYGQK